MFGKRVIQVAVLACASAVGVFTPLGVAEISQSSGDSQGSVPANTAARWQSQARMHRTFSKDHGTLFIDDKGVEFQSRDGRKQTWAIFDIQSFVISPHQLVLESYINRSWHRPGVQRYRFDLTEKVPASVAATLASVVTRPSQNAVPDPESTEIASIRVHHRTLTGGTNGVLRFRNEGIDYVATSAGDSRSWRWEDLQTLSIPDPYHLLIFGYRDTYTFDLKESLSRAVFNRATDEIAAHTGNESTLALEMPLSAGEKRAAAMQEGK